MEIIDKTGQPRSDEEIVGAIQVVENRIVKLSVGDPELFLQFPIIREALKELLTHRERLRKALDRMRDRLIENS